MGSPKIDINRYTKLYSDYYSVVYSVIVSKIHDDDITHDLCQEVFIRYYNKFNEIDNHRSWLLGAVKYVLFEYFRKSKDTSKDIDCDLVMDDVKMTFVNGFRDTRIVIEEAINSIDFFECEINKTLFDLIALHRFSYRKAGEQLGMSERQARYRYNLMVDKLVEYFKKKGIQGLEDLL